MKKMENKKGIGSFVLFEGIGGSGKTKAIEYLVNKLPPEEFVFVKEPGGILREILLDLKNTKMDSFTELCLFTAFRNQQMLDVVIPAIKEGKCVICDRSFPSSFAHQIRGRERSDLLTLFTKMTAQAMGQYYPSPDMQIFFVIRLEEALRRKGKRNGPVDKFDEMDYGHQQRVRDAYLENMPKGKPHRIIDTTSFPEPTKDFNQAGEIALQAILEFIKQRKG